VQAHKGKIWAENLYWDAAHLQGSVKGARFHIELPIDETAPESGQ